MVTRRTFGLQLLGLIVAGPEVLEQLAEPRRKYWPGTSFDNAAVLRNGQYCLEIRSPSGKVYHLQPGERITLVESGTHYAIACVKDVGEVMNVALPKSAIAVRREQVQFEPIRGSGKIHVLWDQPLTLQL